MTITQTMTLFPTPIPSRDDPANFAARADATLGHLEVFVPEANTMIGQINTTETTMNGLLSSTQTQANNAAQSAALANTYKNDALIAAANAGYKGDWLIGTTYAQSETVTYNNRLFISKQNGNVGNTPSDGSAYWALLGTGRIFITRYM